MTTRALFLVLWHAIFFSITGVFIKYTSANISVFEMIFYRSLFAFAFAFTIAKNNLNSSFSSKYIPLLLTRGIFGFFGVSCMFYAMDTLPLAIAMILTLLTPVFVLLISYYSVGESISYKDVSIFASMIVGIVLVLDIEFGVSSVGNVSLFSASIGLVGSLFTAVAFVAMRKALSVVSSTTVIIWFSLCNLIGSFVISVKELSIPAGDDIFFVLAICMLGLLSDYTKTTAYKYADAWIVSLLSLSSIVFSVIWGWSLFGEVLNIVQFIGMLLVLLAIGMSIVNGRNSNKYSKSK